MFTWTNIAIVAGSIAAIGFAADKLMLHRQKNSLHIQLIHMWDYIDGTKFRSVAKEISKKLIKNIEISHLNGNIFRAVVFLLSASWLATTTIFLIFQLSIFNNNFDGLPLFHIYAINFFFDALTIIITYHALKIVATQSHFKGFMAVLIDIFLATSLFVMTVISITHLSIFFSSIGYNAIIQLFFEPNLTEIIEDRYNFAHNETKRIISLNPSLQIIQFLKMNYENMWLVFETKTLFIPIEAQIIFEGGSKYSGPLLIWQEMMAVFYAFSVYIPTTVFMIFVIVFLLAKIFFEIFRSVFMHIIEVITEVDPVAAPHKFAPGTLLAILIGVFATIAKAIAAMIES